MVQDLKVKIDTIKKSPRETKLEMENLGKRSGDIDASITTKVQEIKERNSGVEETSQDIDTIVKENAKHKNLLTQNI